MYAIIQLHYDNTCRQQYTFAILIQQLPNCLVELLVPYLEASVARHPMRRFASREKINYFRKGSRRTLYLLIGALSTKARRTTFLRLKQDVLVLTRKPELETWEKKTKLELENMQYHEKLHSSSRSSSNYIPISIHSSLVTECTYPANWGVGSVRLRLQRSDWIFSTPESWSRDAKGKSTATID